MKICSNCKTSKPYDSFNKNVKRRDGLQTMCRDCSKGYYAEYYKNGKERERLRVKRADEREIIRSYVRSVKSQPCTDCGVSYPWYVMEFDHLRDKEGTIALMVVTHTLSRIKKEIEKCEVVCANCHRQRTYERAHSPVD